MTDRIFIFLLLVMAVGSLIVAGCGTNREVAPEVAVLPPRPAATPIERLELKSDADLEREIATIAETAKGKVGVAAVLIETGEAALVNGDERFPMQSVYKLPISMAVMDQVRLGKLDVEEKVGVTKADMVREGMRSPLRDKDPNGGEFTIRELIRLALVESDGTASDVLMRVAGGGGEIQNFLTQIGTPNVKVVNTEKEIGRDWQTQYDNWATPSASVDMLRWLYAASDCGCSTTDPLSKPVNEMDGQILVVKYMADSNPGAMRLKRLLPEGTLVAHKTGTSGTQNGVTAATNDIGIIRLPNGKHLAIAVYVSDSPADEKTREAVIAKIAKAVWDRHTGAS